jgi:hypothetical protein
LPTSATNRWPLGPTLDYAWLLKTLGVAQGWMNRWAFGPSECDGSDTTAGHPRLFSSLKPTMLLKPPFSAAEVRTAAGWPGRRRASELHEFVRVVGEVEHFLFGDGANAPLLHGQRNESSSARRGRIRARAGL